VRLSFGRLCSLKMPNKALTFNVVEWQTNVAARNAERKDWVHGEARGMRTTSVGAAAW
jgi:hypothetical protein